MKWRMYPVFIAAALAVSACATPDLTPFSKQTASLATAVKAENKAIVDQLEANAKANKDHASNVSRRVRDKASSDPLVKAALEELDDDAKRWMAVADGVSKQTKKIDQALEASVAYADALVALAAAGEKGGEAWESFMTSLEAAGKAVDVAVPLAGETVTIVNKIAGTLAQWYTRMEAQETLIEIMAESQTHLDTMTADLNQVYGKWVPGPNATVMNNLVLAVVESRKARLLDEHGRNRIALYEGLAVDAVLTNKRDPAATLLQTRFDIFAGTLGSEIGRTPADQGIQTGTMAAEFNAYRDIIQTEEPNYLAYKKKEDAIDAWQNKRKAAAAAIANVLTKWAKTHKKVLEELERCGGFDVVKTECVRLSGGTLDEALEALKLAQGVISN